ncbi:hypothetical protein LAHI110946_12645 [Lactococcus hircilactis]
MVKTIVVPLFKVGILNKIAFVAVGAVPTAASADQPPEPVVIVAGSELSL